MHATTSEEGVKRPDLIMKRAMAEETINASLVFNDLERVRELMKSILMHDVGHGGSLDAGANVGLFSFELGCRLGADVT